MKSDKINSNEIRKKIKGSMDVVPAPRARITNVPTSSVDKPKTNTKPKK